MMSYLILIFINLCFNSFGKPSTIRPTPKSIIVPKNSSSKRQSSKKAIKVTKNRSFKSKSDKKSIIAKKNQNFNENAKQMTVTKKYSTFSKADPKNITVTKKNKKSSFSKSIEVIKPAKQKIIRKYIKKDNPKLISVPYGYNIGKKKRKIYIQDKLKFGFGHSILLSLLYLEKASKEENQKKKKLGTKFTLYGKSHYLPGYNIYGFFEYRNKLLLLGCRFLVGYKVLRIYPTNKFKDYPPDFNRLNSYINLFPRIHLYPPTKKRKFSFFIGPEFLILVQSILPDYDRYDLARKGRYSDGSKPPLPRFNKSFVMMLGWGCDFQFNSGFILGTSFYHSLGSLLNNEYILEIDQKSGSLHIFEFTFGYDFAPLL